MTIDSELVAIGVALLGIILGTWVLLHGIDKKLGELLLLTKSRKKEEDANHANSTQTDD